MSTATDAATSRRALACAASRSVDAAAASSPAVSRSRRRSARDARPGRGQPPLQRQSPLDARRIPDHQLPHAPYVEARRLGQQRVELGDEASGRVLAEVVERIGLHDDAAHAHRLRPANERGGLRDALHLGRLDRPHQRHVGVAALPVSRDGRPESRSRTMPNRPRAITP